MTSTTSYFTDEDTMTTISRPSSTAFLCKAPPLTYRDFKEIDMNYHPSDIQMIDEFEELWLKYLQENPEALPTGKKGKRIEKLEEKLQNLQTSKQNVQAELQRQLEFFEKSKEQLEVNFERAKVDAKKGEERKVNEMHAKLECVGSAMRNMEANGDWELFFEALQSAVDQSEVKTLPGDGLATILGITSQSPRAKSSIMKPSAKAMYLNSAALESDAHIKSRDFLLRAYRIDNALLKAQVKTLQRDVERVEKTTEILDLVGKFLTEHNIYGILSTSGASTTRGGNTVPSKSTRR